MQVRYDFVGCGRTLVCSLCCVLALSVVPGFSRADDAATRTIRRASDSQDLSAAVIRSRSDEAARTKDIDEVTRGSIAELYQTATRQLQLGDEESRAARGFQTRADQQRLRVLVHEKSAELERLRTATPWLPTIRDRSRLEAALADKNEEVAQLKTAFNQVVNESKYRTQRRTEIHRELPTARAQWDEVQQELEFATDANEHPLLMLARKTELRSRRRQLEYHVGRMELELEAYDTEDGFNLSRHQRNLLERQLELTEAEHKQLNDRVKKLQSEQSELAVSRARDEFIKSHAQLKPYAERNLVLAQQAQALTASIGALEVTVKKTKELRDDVDQKFEYVQAKEKLIGQSGAIGLLLRKTRAELPDTAQLSRNLATRRELIDDIGFKLLGYDEELKPLLNPEPLINKIVAGAQLTPTTDADDVDADRQPDPFDPHADRNARPALDRSAIERTQYVQAPQQPQYDEFGRRLKRRDPIEELRASATYAINRQRQSIESLKKKQNQYYKLLWEIDTAERELVSKVDTFSAFIDARVLWIRSGQLLSPWSLESASTRELAIFNPASWSSTLRALHSDFRRNPEVALLALVMFFVAMRINRSIGRSLRHASDEAKRPSCLDLWLTTRVFSLTLVRSALFPAVPAYLGWRLHQAAADSTFPTAVANALLTMALVGWPLRLTSLICKREGLAESHLGWPRTACDVIRRQLRWLIPTALGLLFMNVILDETNRDPSYTAMERILFISGMVALAGFFRRVFRPLTGVLNQYADNEERPWLDRLQNVAYYAGLSIPLGLAVMSVLGYDYTARQMAWKLYATGGLAFGLLLIHGVMVRQMSVRHRKLSFQMTGSYQQPVGANDLSRKYYSSSDIVAQAQSNSHTAELLRMLTQTAQFLRTMGLVGFLAGAWMIWGDVVPALKFFDNWPLWTVEVTQVLANGATQIVNQPITLPHVCLAGLLAACTWIAVKNLPGLLDFTLLERLPIDKSVRYAINALACYALTLFGCIAVFGTLGVSWGKVQWLATALTFGLAFGLQEVFANFVSGIIILFERPLRIGDVVTIGEVTGVVSNIRMRATTITNWDRQEFVVPNKEFITGRLLNWTLSDHVNRIVIQTGVAYGSDADQVRRLILDVATRHPSILRDPPPTVTFDSFGDNALSFTLRAFLPTMDLRLGAINDLHTQIYKTLNEHKIEIAFPQQDIHIKTLPAEVIQLFDQSKQPGPQALKPEVAKQGPIHRAA